ncbi:SDR family oxidoreductase [Halobellus limi]|uniref:NAD(P)-dependent dehydrogenase, short-chain alcohol dehydrogenase family n=1 Tax=Halobellus limi TaxID=699433 RepID=A0A1H6AYI4_9EURY|nr:SDR family oxidoreductase [Halobellus limi]QCC47815.1 SDR family oxidoreductase [Halobellus limi]SEG53472.1 NAD(P)-dependent dehydrogenase, short-chain alcohol dehydrogenase family [Halobellus limi]
MVDGTVCIVAGGGNGLGRAAAHELAAHGARVVVNDLGCEVDGTGSDASVPEDVAEAIRERGGTATAHHGDVSDFEYAERLIADTVAEYGRVDFVCNFAGILRDGISYKLSEEDWREVIETNLTGQFAPLRAAAKHWREASEEQSVESDGDESDDGGFDRQRSYLAVSAGAARGSLGQANYAAAKAGVLGMVRSVSNELIRSNVRVNALVPNGYTRMTETVPEEHRPYTESEMPPEKVAPLVAYLASEAAEDVTGCTLYAGGDRVGVFSDPATEAVGVSPDGWTLESLSEHFREDVAGDVELSRTESYL